MGLLAGAIPAQTNADDVITYDGNTYNASATGEKWTRITAKCTTTPWNASTTFTSSTNIPYNNGSALYYIAKPTGAAIAISATAGTQLYAWSVSGTNTTISTKNTYKSFTIPVPDYSNAFNKKVWEFDYVSPGGIKTWSAPHTGTYTLECWGAGGGSGYKSTYTTGMYAPAGGYGGYSTGQISFTASGSCFIVVGGSGNNGELGSNQVTPAGYNGGGAGAWNLIYSGQNHPEWYGRAGSGGGATHFGLKSGLLTAFSSDYSINLLLVAGGGGGGAAAGGSAYVGTGGHGGGYSGTNGGSSNGSPNLGNGGTQSTGNAFGLGGTRNSNQGVQPGGGGGGGFYGGVAGGYGGTVWGDGGGGGSGYINTNSGKLSNAAMYGYGVTTSSATATKTYSTSNVSSTATAQYAKTGNGYARITYTKP